MWLKYTNVKCFVFDVQKVKYFRMGYLLYFKGSSSLLSRYCDLMYEHTSEVLSYAIVAAQSNCNEVVEILEEDTVGYLLHAMVRLIFTGLSCESMETVVSIAFIKNHFILKTLSKISFKKVYNLQR